MSLLATELDTLTQSVAAHAKANPPPKPKRNKHKFSSEVAARQIADYLKRHGRKNRRELTLVFDFDEGDRHAGRMSKALGRGVAKGYFVCVSKPQERYHKEYEVR